MQCHHRFRRQRRSGFFARAVSGVRGWQACETVQDSGQDRGGDKELTKICGWAQPSRLELSATDTLAEFISSIRQAPRPRAMAEHVEANGVGVYAPLQETQSVVL